MAKHRELASIVSNKIWRTVVVAGAMLATPAIGCGGGAKKPTPVAPSGDQGAPAGDPVQSQADKDAADKAALEKEAADKAATDAAMLAEKEAADKAAADKEAADKAAADKEAADKAAADKKKRPRGGGERPTGRGFILS